METLFKYLFTFAMTLSFKLLWQFTLLINHLWHIYLVLLRDLAMVPFVLLQFVSFLFQTYQFRKGSIKSLLIHLNLFTKYGRI